MTITTKFSIGDTVWVKLVNRLDHRNPKIDFREITGFRIDFEKNHIYQLEKYRGPFPFEYNEADVYATEAELRAAYPELTEYSE